MKPTSSVTMSSVAGTSSHHSDKNTQKNKSRNWQKGRVVPSKGILVNQGLKKIKLEEDFIPIKVETNATTEATSENGDEDDMFTEEFTVTKEEMNSSVVPPEKSGQEGQGSLSCSCQEEVESLKNAVKQLTLQVKKHNVVITKIKSSLRNAVLSVMTCCQDDEEEDEANRNADAGSKSTAIIETPNTTSRSVSEDPLVVQNAESQECIPMSRELENPQDNLEGSVSKISVEKSSGVPNVFLNKSLASLETFTSEGGSRDLGQTMENAEIDDDKDFGADEDKLSEVNDDKRSEMEEDQHSKVDNDMGIQKESPYKCHLCTKVFKNPSGVYQHIRSVHEGVRYKCTKCPAKFTHLCTVRKHESQVHEDGGPPTQKCGICGVHLLKSKASLAIHVSQVHKKSELKSTHHLKGVQRLRKIGKPVRARAITFQCPHCPISFPEKEALRCHMSKVHGITSEKEARK